MGIPEELREAVFEMYRQGDGSLTRRHAGIGLGLYIVKRLAEGLHGQIRLSSTPGGGTTFHLTVPVTLATEEAAAAAMA
jgi:signal transduction histidine kinase